MPLNHSSQYAELTEFHRKAYEIVDVLSELIQGLPEMEEEGLTRKVTGR
nr:hypothetical protein BN993_04377 [Virgibacillus halodenitrificans]